MSTPQPEIVILGTARIMSLARKDKRTFNTSSGAGPKGAAWPIGGPYDVEVIAARAPDGKVNGAIPDGPIPDKASFPRQISLSHLRAMDSIACLKATFTEGAKLVDPEQQEDTQTQILRKLQEMQAAQAERAAAHAAEVAALRAEVAALKAAPASTPPGAPRVEERGTPAPKPAVVARPTTKPAAKATPLPSDSPADPVPSSGAAP